MESTRASITSTVDELRDRVSETFDWRHYVDRYPGTSLAVAVALGVLVGRGTARTVGGVWTGGERGESSESGYHAGAALGESALHPVAPRPASYDEHAVSGPRRAISQSWGRLGSRVEGIVNRVIDELTDAIETAVVPAVGGWVRNHLDLGGGSGWSMRPAGERAGQGGVHPGGPAGSQHYPTHGRTAEQG